MSAHGPMPRSAWIFPVLAVLFFAGATALGISFTPSPAGLAFAAVLLVILFGTVFAAVHHAEVIARADRRALRHAAVDARRHHHRGRADRDHHARRKAGADVGARHRVRGGDDRLQRPGRRLYPDRRPALPRTGCPGQRVQPLSQRADRAGDDHADHAQLYADHAGTGLLDGPARRRQRRHHPALWRVPLYPDHPASRLFHQRIR